MKPPNPALYSSSCSCSWLLLRHFAQKFPTLDGQPLSKLSEEDDQEVLPEIIPELSADDVNVFEPGVIVSENEESLFSDHKMPEVTYEEARVIMTRTDFIDPLDVLHVSSLHTNIFIYPIFVFTRRVKSISIDIFGLDNRDRYET